MEAYVGAASVPVIVALGEGFKRMFGDHPRAQVAFAIACGLVINVGLAWGVTLDMRVVVLDGLVYGLAASGLYSGAKALAGK